MEGGGSPSPGGSPSRVFTKRRAEESVAGSSDSGDREREREYERSRSSIGFYPSSGGPDPRNRSASALGFRERERERYSGRRSGADEGYEYGLSSSRREVYSPNGLERRSSLGDRERERPSTSGSLDHRRRHERERTGYSYPARREGDVPSRRSELRDGDRDKEGYVSSSSVATAVSQRQAPSAPSSAGKDSPPVTANSHPSILFGRVQELEAEITAMEKKHLTEMSALLAALSDSQDRTDVYRKRIADLEGKLEEASSSKQHNRFNGATPSKAGRGTRRPTAAPQIQVDSQSPSLQRKHTRAASAAQPSR